MGIARRSHSENVAAARHDTLSVPSFWSNMLCPQAKREHNIARKRPHPRPQPLGATTPWRVQNAWHAFLRTRRHTRACKQPATETVIVAVRRAGRAIRLAGFRNHATNLARRCGERELLAVRLVPRHLGNQKFKVVGHALLQQIRRAPQERALPPAAHPFYNMQ